MAINLCHSEKTVRGITNGPILVHLGRDIFKIAPQVKFFDVMIRRPFPVGFFANTEISEAMLSFLAEVPKEPLIFFNVSATEEDVGLGEAGETILFFNVYDEVKDIELGEAGGTILYFNVGYTDDPYQGEAGGTILFFNVSDEEEICL